MRIGKVNIRKLLFITMWALLATGTITLLVAAYAKNQTKVCTGVAIQIDGPDNHFFVDKNDVWHVIHKYAGKEINGKLIKTFPLQRMEKELEVNPWISHAVMYFDIRGVLNVQLEEREPVARLYTTDGGTCYIDKTCRVLPLSNKHLAEVPIFIGFTGNPDKLTKADSGIIQSIKYMSLHIQKDSFLHAMIDQVVINSKKQFEIVPSIGKQEVFFGDTTDLEKKFEKFTLYYKKAIPIYGWNKYNILDLTYKNQIVGKIKDAAAVKADSLRAIQIMKTLAECASRMAEDTTNKFRQDSLSRSMDISMILQSLPRDYDVEENIDTAAKRAEPLTKQNSPPPQATPKPLQPPKTPSAEKKNGSAKTQEKKSTIQTPHKKP